MAHVPATAGEAVDVGAIEAAAASIAGQVRETPVIAAPELSQLIGVPARHKAECLQLTGSFKVRGALHKIQRLDRDRRAGGVVAASAGNHARAVALIAAQLGVSADLFMPAEAPLAKISAVRRHGAEVHLVPGSYDDAAAQARGFAESEGRALIEPFDDAEIVAGQGTVGLELARQAPDTRLVVVPLGGGALAAGVAIAVKARLPGVRVVGVQAAACAPYIESLAAHRPIGARNANTICDGIAVKHPGELTLPLVETFVDDVVAVSDDQVAEAMVSLLEESKLVVEGAGAVGVAALRAGQIEPPREGGISVILSGGNVDASRLGQCIRLGETFAGRRIVLSTVVPDRPGALAALLRLIAGRGANVVDVEHLREGVELHVRESLVQLVLQTNGPEHSAEIVEAVRAEGFEARAEGSGAAREDDR